MSEEEAKEILYNLVDKYIDERKLDIKDVETILTLLDLYQKEKEKNLIFKGATIVSDLEKDGIEIKMNADKLVALYLKEKEKNTELEEQLRKANEYIRNEMYIDDNPTICGDEEDTITELPISLNLYNEGLRELLKLLEERN